MQVVSIPSNITYSNLYTLSSFAAGTSLIVTNNTSSPAFLIQAVSPPLASSDQYPLIPGQTVLVHGNANPIWVRGGSGPLIIQSILETITPFTGVDLPRDLYTSDNEGYRRMRVDVGQTGFFEGREFRTFKEFSIAAGATYVVKVVVPINAILFEQGVEIDDGSIRIVNASGGTPGGTFSETLPVVAKNNMSTRPTPFYTSQLVWTAGGTHTGGFIFDTHRAVAASATAQQSTVGNIVGDERGVAANTYYIRYENFGSGAATGTLWFFWEERPA